ncbi:M949_RS01915 family surface polysaccharide biosynthesis protein [Chryseobacterium sp. Mn2064]|uniref:M949_RS01915 family surface polysaccharide biosynthesis protein n=1 Tax=Chryseobacterium sp. Mn2064 TaxID=3395263 RepID=UPI003BCC3E8D
MKTIYFLYTLPFIAFVSCKEEKRTAISTPAQETLQIKKTDSLTTTRIDSTQIPKPLEYKGNFKEGFRWKDKTGEYIVVTSETGIYRNESSSREIGDSSDAEVFASCYSLGTHQQIWKVNDFVKDCPVDIVAEFTKNSLAVTDLDKNGTAEIWMTYKTVCHGDVSPSNMKIIMYEGTNKFAMRGESRLQYGIDDNNKPLFEGGKYTFDKAFKEGPDVFREYAEKMWNKHMNE